MAFRSFTNLKIEGVRPTGRELGRGSYGEVIEVEWCSTICAAKRMHDIFLHSVPERDLDKMIRNFEKECQTWSTLRHPNIVQYLGNYHPPDTRIPIFVLEKMDTSVRRYLERHSHQKSFLLTDKVFVLRQVAQGLCYLHEKNPPLVHHDLTPNNVLLNEQTFHAKLTDFGLTRAIDRRPATSSNKGTPDFMPPEDSSKSTEKLDIFSYGNCILTIMTHEWPSPTQATQLKGKKLIAFSEYERREEQAKLLSDREKKLFLPLIKKCLLNHPLSRPSSATIVDQMRQIESKLQKSEPSILSQLQEAISQLSIECRQKAQLEDDKQQLNKVLEEERKLNREERQHYQSEIKELKDIKDVADSQRKLNSFLDAQVNQLSKEKEQLEQQLAEQLSKHQRELQEEKQRHELQVQGILKQVNPGRNWRRIRECKSKYPGTFSAIAIEKALGIIVVADNWENKISVLEEDGKEICHFPSATNNSALISGIFSIAFTNDGQIVTSDYNTDTVSFYSIQSNQLQKQISLMEKPMGLAIHKSGKLFICQPTLNRVCIYNPDGKPLCHFGSKGREVGQFDYPYDIAIGPDELLYISDQNNARIQMFAEEAAFVHDFAIAGKPGRLCVTEDSHVITSILHTNRILIYTNDGELVREFTIGMDPQIFDLAVGKDDKVYVCTADWLRVY